MRWQSLLAVVAGALTAHAQASYRYCVKSPEPTGGVFYTEKGRLIVCGPGVKSFEKKPCELTVQGKCVYQALVRKKTWDMSSKPTLNETQTKAVRDLVITRCEPVMFRPYSDGFQLLSSKAVCPSVTNGKFIDTVAPELLSFYAGNDLFCENHGDCVLQTATCYCVSQAFQFMAYDEIIGSDDPLTGSVVTVSLGLESEPIEPAFPLKENMDGNIQSQFIGRIITIKNTRTSSDSDLRAWLIADTRPFLVKIEDRKIVIPEKIIAQDLYLSITIPRGSDYHHYNRFQNETFDYTDVSVMVPEDSVKIPVIEVVVEQWDLGLVVIASVLFGILVILLMPFEFCGHSRSLGKIARTSTLILAAQGVAGTCSRNIVGSSVLKSCFIEGSNNRTCEVKINTDVFLKSPGFEACIQYTATLPDTDGKQSVTLPLSVKLRFEKLETIVKWAKEYETRDFELVKVGDSFGETTWNVGYTTDEKDGCNPATKLKWARESIADPNFFEDRDGVEERIEHFKEKILNGRTGKKGFIEFDNFGQIGTKSCLFYRYVIDPQGPRYEVMKPIRTDYRIHLEYEIQIGKVTKTGKYISTENAPIEGDDVKIKVEFRGKYQGTTVSFEGFRLIQKVGDTSEAYLFPVSLVSPVDQPSLSKIGELQAAHEAAWGKFRGFSWADDMVLASIDSTKSYTVSIFKNSKGLPWIFTNFGNDKQFPSKVGDFTWMVREQFPGEIFSYDPDDSSIETTISLETEEDGSLKFEYEEITLIKPNGRFVAMQGNFGPCVNNAEVILEAWSELDEGPVRVLIENNNEAATGLQLLTQFIIIKNTFPRLTTRIKFRSLKNPKPSFNIILVDQKYSVVIPVSGTLLECRADSTVNQNGTVSIGYGSVNESSAFLGDNFVWLLPVSIGVLFVIVGVPLLVKFAPRMNQKAKKN
jgi:hypothetical protein